MGGHIVQIPVYLCLEERRPFWELLGLNEYNMNEKVVVLGDLNVHLDGVTDI